VDYVHQFFAGLYRKRTVGGFNRHFKDVLAADVDEIIHGSAAAKPVHEKMRWI